MIWLASFPRSGNTFFRIVLHEVYGLKSSAYQLDPTRQKNKEYFKAEIVKTHVLPNELEPSDPSIPVVYLVRDGRDAVVSLAHHTKDIVLPGSDYYLNMREIILARENSYFGGWRKNVMKWLPRASVVLHFEDLIADPIGTVEKIRPWIDLPEPRPEKLPTFDDLRKKETPYGPSKKTDTTSEEYKDRKKQFFRRGKTGAWQDEMPMEYQEMFWLLHGDAMRAMGYLDGEIKPNANLGLKLYRYLDHNFEDRGLASGWKNKLILRNWPLNDQ